MLILWRVAHERAGHIPIVLLPQGVDLAQDERVPVVLVGRSCIFVVAAVRVYDAELRPDAAAVRQRVAVLVDVARLGRDLDLLGHEDAAPRRREHGPEDGHARADAGRVDLERRQQDAERPVPRRVARRVGGHLVRYHFLEAPCC